MPTHCFEGTASVGGEHMCNVDCASQRVFGGECNLSFLSSFYARQLKGPLTPGVVPPSYTRTEGSKWKLMFCMQTVTTEPLHQTLLQPSGFRDRSAPTENDDGGFRQLHPEAGNKGVLQQHPRSCLDLAGVQTRALNGSVEVFSQ